MSRLEIPCRIVRHTEQQGTCPSVVRQAEVEKYATGCGKMLVPSKHLERQTNSKIHQVRSMFNLRIGTINVQTAKDEMKLAENALHVKNIKHDICFFQETHKIGEGEIEFNDV